MPRPDTPPVVWIERTPKGRMVAIFADGRVAGREQGEGNTWQPIDHIDYHALWPAPAPVAPIADIPVRYGAFHSRLPGFWWCNGGAVPCLTEHDPTTLQCSGCGDLRPEPTP